MMRLSVLTLAVLIGCSANPAPDNEMPDAGRSALHASVAKLSPLIQPKMAVVRSSPMTTPDTYACRSGTSGIKNCGTPLQAPLGGLGYAADATVPSDGQGQVYDSMSGAYKLRSVPVLSSATPANVGTSSAGAATTAARSDHVHALPGGGLTLPKANGGFGSDVSTGLTNGFIVRVAAGAITIGALLAGDLPAGIDAAKIAAGTVSNTIFGYLANISSDVQSQLNGKQATLTLPLSKANGGFGIDVSTGLTNGFVARVATGAVTIGAILAGDLPTGIDVAKLATGTVTNTVFGYLANVSSDIQAQIATLLPASSAKLPPTPTAAGKTLYDTGSAYAELDASMATVVLHSGTTPSWSAVSLTADVTGLLPNANLANPSFTLTASAGFTCSISTVALGSTVGCALDSAVAALLATTQTFTGAKTLNALTLGGNAAAGGFKWLNVGAPTPASSDAATATYAESVATTAAAAAKTGGMVLVAQNINDISINDYIGMNSGTSASVATNVIPFVASAGTLKNCSLWSTGATSAATSLTAYKATGATNSPSYSATSQVIAVGNGNKYGHDTTGGHTVTTAQDDLLIWKSDHFWSAAGLAIYCQFIPTSP